MRLRDYVNERLDEGESNATIEGLQNNVRCNLVDAVNIVPSEDWNAEIGKRQKEYDGQMLIWLVGHSEPGYSIQE